MGLRQSKEEALYLHATCGNVEGVRALRQDGAGLEWVDKDGKTPLIFACLRPDGLEMVKTLLELGANINAYRPGAHAGTPLHHAAKKGNEQIVNLLLSFGANVLRVNDDCRTPLDLARAKGHCNVVRNIENHICLFAGWLRELYGPGFLEVIAPKWVSRKIWAVILPCNRRSSTSPPRFELAIYPTPQVAQPQIIIPLWKINIEEANLDQPDPVVVIVDKENRKRFKFLSANEGDKQQLLLFYSACTGMQQPSPAHGSLPMVTPIPNPYTASSASVPVLAPEDPELAMAINASLQSAAAERLASGIPSESQNVHTNDWANSENQTNNGWGPPAGPSSSAEGTSDWGNDRENDGYNGWTALESKPSNSTQHHESQEQGARITSPLLQNVSPTPAPPSAPTLNESFNHGTIRYPTIDSTPIDSTMHTMDSGTCAICLDAPVEGACIPCGHMAGCMACLNEIKTKKWGCPVCRAKIDQVIKIYSV